MPLGEAAKRTEAHMLRVNCQILHPQLLICSTLQHKDQLSSSNGFDVKQGWMLKSNLHSFLGLPWELSLGLELYRYSSTC